MERVSRYTTSVAAVFFAVAFVAAPDTSAQAKKMTYEQAFATCKAEMSKTPGMSRDETRETAGRYAAGGACMKRHGYRLKKGTMM